MCDFLYILPKSYYFSQDRRGRVTHALGVMHGLAKNGIKLTVVTGEGINKYKKELPMKTKLIELKQSSFWAWNFSLMKAVEKLLLKNDRIKMVILRYSVSSFFLFIPLLKKFKDRKWIIEVNSLAYHQLDFLPRFLRRIILFIEIFLLKKANFIYVVSKKLKIDIQLFMKEEEKILVIPNAGEKKIAKKYSDFRNFNNFLNRKTRFVYLGKFHEYYDFIFLIKAFKKMSKKYKNIELHFYGDGSMEEKMKIVAGDEKGILFHGRYDLDKINFSEVFKNSILLIPYKAGTLAEIGSPTKLFEYMALGLPIIASNVGQIKDILQHKKNALIYNSEDINSLISCFEEIILDSRLRMSLAMNSKKEFLDNHTWEKRMNYFLSNIQE